MGFLDARFGAYLLVATLLIVTPGPDTALVIRNTLAGGRRAASYTALGIAAGSVVWALASVGGIAALLEASTLAFTVFKIAGAIYLGYLGLRSLIGSFGAHTAATVATPLAAPPTQRASFRQGLLSNLLNPKAGAIFVTALPQFINPGDSPARLLEMLFAYEIILLVWLNLYGLVLSRVGQRRLGARVGAQLQRVTGVALLALGLRLALERR